MCVSEEECISVCVSYLKHSPVILQHLLLHLHQLGDGLVEGKELGRHLLLRGTEQQDEGGGGRNLPQTENRSPEDQGG